MNCPICNNPISLLLDHEEVYDCNNRNSKVDHNFTIYYSLDDPRLIEEYYVSINGPKFRLAVDSYFKTNESYIFFNKQTLKFPYTEPCDILTLFNKVRKMHAFL
jgi:hypothetical protein